MKAITVILLFCFAALARAHPGEEQAAQSGYDCEHPPADAVNELPALLGRIGQFVCMPTGPTILANKAWSWRYTGSFFDLPTIPGYAHKDSTGLPPPFYFTKLSTHELNAADAARRSEQLQEQLENYRPKNPPVEMSVTDATNNYGNSITIYAAMESEDNGWVIVCTPQCRLDYVILVNKRQRH